MHGGTTRYGAMHACCMHVCMCVCMCTTRVEVLLGMEMERTDAVKCVARHEHAEVRLQVLRKCRIDQSEVGLALA